VSSLVSAPFTNQFTDHSPDDQIKDPLTNRQPPLNETPPSADAALSAESSGAAAELLRSSGDGRVRRYASSFADLMEMRAPKTVVGAYLDRHEGWFRRCAAPMTVKPLAGNGYVLTLGRFGNFGFEVEPTIGLELLPQDEGVYRIVTVAVPDADATLQGLYDVEFNASLRLDEASPAEASHEEVDELMQHTMVRWELDLAVWIRLPAMLALLPDNLVQSSGDHLLRQIVRQISRKLTWKVQEDFHASHGIPCPPRRRAQF
jgi:hypothetical protein